MRFRAFVVNAPWALLRRSGALKDVPLWQWLYGMDVWVNRVPVVRAALLIGLIAGMFVGWWVRR